MPRFREGGVRACVGFRVAIGDQRLDDRPRMGRDPAVAPRNDPDRLEPRLGRPASQGSVRTSAAVNQFLDQYGVLDADYEQAAKNDERILAVLSPTRQTKFVGGQCYGHYQIPRTDAPKALIRGILLVPVRSRLPQRCSRGAPRCERAVQTVSCARDQRRQAATAGGVPKRRLPQRAISARSMACQTGKRRVLQVESLASLLTTERRQLNHYLAEEGQCKKHPDTNGRVRTLLEGCPARHCLGQTDRRQSDRADGLATVSRVSDQSPDAGRYTRCITEHARESMPIELLAPSLARHKS